MPTAEKVTILRACAGPLKLAHDLLGGDKRLA
jgi:hypothetical protein